MPKFSVVIPVYNKEKYLSKTIESVLVQSFIDFEIILVNDGSTDASEAIIKSVSDTRLQYIYQENLGVSVARNTGVAAASGEFIALLDGDDLWHPNYLEELNNVVRKHPEQHVFACTCIIQTKHKSITPIYSVAEMKPDRVYVLHYFTSSYINTLLTSSSTILHKSVFKKIGGYNPSIRSGEDTDLWIRLGLNYLVVFLNMPLATYRYDAFSLSNSPKKVKNTLHLDRYEDQIENHTGLKKFLDLNRYSLAIIAKRTGAKEEAKRLTEKIATTSLNSKQHFLLNTPSILLKVLFQIKLIAEKFGLQLSAYK